MTDEATEDPTLDDEATDVEPTHATTDSVDGSASVAGDEERTSAEAADGDIGGTSRRRRRGSLVVYGVAFGLLVVAAACLIVGALGIASYIVVAENSFFGTQRILRISALFSGLAIVVAVVAVLVPRRTR